jgi:hypothetical protein
MNRRKQIHLSIVFAAVLFITIPVSVLPQSGKPVVSDIQAEAISQTTIKITWKLPENKNIVISSLQVFRASKPFASTVDLSADKPLAELAPGTLFYNDMVKNYHEYYYALIVTTKDGPYRIILPTINATVNGVHVKTCLKKNETATLSESAKERLPAAGTLRGMPLPRLDILEGQTETPVTMSREALESARELSGSLPEDAKIRLSPYAFEEDMISPPGGDEYTLFDILHTTFAKEKYTEGTEKLTAFLNINRNENITDRSLFYLAECQYFSGDYRNAIMSFLKVQDKYPVLTRQWIESSLDLINIPY